MNKHTPRPWTVGKKTWSSHVIAPSKFGPHPLAVFSGRGRDEDDANAALAAAAPDLLKELTHLVRLLEPLEQAGRLDIPGLATLNGPRAAIAKARGQKDIGEEK